MSKPFGFVTETGQFVSKSALDKYALKSDESNQLVDDPFQNSYGSLSLREPIYNPLKLATLMELNGYHESCVYTKAHDVAGTGYYLKNVDGKANDQDIKTLTDFFGSEYWSPTKVFGNTEVDYGSMGYAGAEVIKEKKAYDGPILRLRHVISHTIRMDNTRQRFVQQIGTNKVYYKAVPAGNDIIDGSNLENDLHKTNGTWHPKGTLPPESRATELLFFNRYHPRDKFYGIPQIVPAITTITGDISRARYNTTFFDNYAVPSYAVFITGNYADKDIKDADGKIIGTELQKAIKDHFKQLAKNPHSTLILALPTDDKDEGEVKVEFKPLAVDIKEASFRLYRKDNRDEIVSKHKVPPYRIGIYETGSLAGNLGIESTKIYRDSEVKPNQEKYYPAINDYIIKTCFGIEHVEFVFNPLSIDETTQDLEEATKLSDKGAMTPNDLIRFFGKKFGLEEIDHPAMNAHYINGTAIDYTPEVNDDPNVIKILDNMRDDLLEVAKNEFSNKDGYDNRGVIESIKRHLS